MQKPENEIFESAFKEAFEKANLAPPDIVWENIEKAMPQGSIVDSSMAEKTMALQTKLIIGTTIVLVSVVAYFYINNSLTNNYKEKIDPINHETNITKPIESTNLDSELGAKKLANSPSFNPQKSNKIKIGFPKPSFSKTQNEEVLTSQINLETQSIEVPENRNLLQGDFSEMKSLKLKLPKIELDLPSLEINTDSQKVVPYFDNNTIGQPLNEKGKFWQNFRVRGGIRVSNQ